MSTLIYRGVENPKVPLEAGIVSLFGRLTFSAFLVENEPTELTTDRDIGRCCVDFVGSS
jgi:hypothetical protein